MRPHISLGGEPYAGKSTIARRLVTRWGALWVPRVTTRKLRWEEEEGWEYTYRTEARFDKLMSRGDLIEESKEVHLPQSSKMYHTAVFHTQHWPVPGSQPLVSVYGAKAPVVKKLCAPDMITIFLKISKEEYVKRKENEDDVMRREFEYRWSQRSPESVEPEFDYVVTADGTRDACITRIEEIVEEVTGIKLVG